MERECERVGRKSKALAGWLSGTLSSQPLETWNILLAGWQALKPQGVPQFAALAISQIAEWLVAQAKRFAVPKTAFHYDIFQLFEFS